MKFGERLEQASVPGWSLHNVDYNSLKHQIKVHTTKDQATAVALTIPGQPDHTLKRFEDAFYHELCSQHNRVGLFVTSKADEISRRLRMSLSSLVFAPIHGPIHDPIHSLSTLPLFRKHCPGQILDS